MFNFLNKSKRIYLDYAAATPVRKEVALVMAPYWSNDFANPSSIHKEGVATRQAVDEARERVARTLRVRADDTIFTSGGTESNNLALFGTLSNLSDVSLGEVEIISTLVEHPSVLETLKVLESKGVKIYYAPIDLDGEVIVSEFEKLLSTKTRLVSIAYANSETGVIQDIGRLSRVIRSFEKENSSTILFHTDAAQAPLWLPCALDSLGVDMMTLDAGKCEGPKGVGMLIKRSRVKLTAVTYGGRQEFGFRPGTEPTPLIVGGVAAVVLAQEEYKKRSSKATALRDRFIKKLLKIPGVILNGSSNHRLSNNVNISIPGFDSEFAVISLDRAGVACGTKSACSGAGSGQSRVVYEMTGDSARASSTIRFTFGPQIGWKELQKTVNILREFMERNKTFKLNSAN